MVSSRDRPEADQHDVLADEVWQLITDALFSRKNRFLEVANELSLTPGECHALRSLEVDEGRPMRALAEEWHCDASNVTWLVDRLEERGFAARRVSPTDRRVKTVALTPAGVEAQERLNRLLYAAPDELRALEIADLGVLVEILRKVELPGAGARARHASSQPCAVPTP